MTEHLKLEAAVDFIRAHRFGKMDKKTRPIVCRFKTFSDRETVRKQATNLKGTHYSINEQFPKEVNDRRKELWKYYKEAKEQERKACFRRDKLFIDGVQFKKPQMRGDFKINGNRENRSLRERYEKQGA